MKEALRAAGIRITPPKAIREKKAISDLYDCLLAEATEIPIPLCPGWIGINESHLGNSNDVVWNYHSDNMNIIALQKLADGNPGSPPLRISKNVVNALPSDTLVIPTKEIIDFSNYHSVLGWCIKSMILNTPLLDYFNCMPSRILGLIVPDGAISSTVDNLMCEHVQEVREHDLFPEKIIINPATSALIYRLTTIDKKTPKIIEMLNKCIDGHLKSTLCKKLMMIIVTDLQSIIDPNDRIFTITMSDISISALKGKYIPSPADLSLLKTQIANSRTNKDRMNVAFIASGLCINPVCLDDKSEFECLSRIVNQIETNSRDYHDSGSVPVTFIKNLYSSMKNNLSNCVNKESALSNELVRKMQSLFIWDEKYVYISEMQFRGLTRNLGMGSPAIKKHLFNDGILCAKNSREYPFEVSLKDLSNRRVRQSMLKIDISKISSPDGINILDYLKGMEYV